MSDIIDLQSYRQIKEGLPDEHGPSLSDENLMRAQASQISDNVELLLENMARDRAYAQTVALAAGRFATMQLFQNHGRAQTLAFFEDCVQTAELCEDILKQMDDDF